MEQRTVVSGKELIKIAKTTSPIGIKGDVKIVPLFFNVEELNGLFSLCKNEIYLVRGSEFPKRVSLSSSRESKDHLSMTFEGIETRTQATDLSKLDVYVPYPIYSKYVQDTNNVFGYIGYMVEDRKLGAVGKVTDVLRQVQTLLVVDDKLVPFVKEFVESIDYNNKLIKTNLPEGLLE